MHLNILSFMNSFMLTTFAAHIMILHRNKVIVCCCLRCVVCNCKHNCVFIVLNIKIDTIHVSISCHFLQMSCAWKYFMFILYDTNV